MSEVFGGDLAVPFFSRVAEQCTRHGALPDPRRPSRGRESAGRTSECHVEVEEKRNVNPGSLSRQSCTSYGDVIASVRAGLPVIRVHVYDGTITVRI